MLAVEHWSAQKVQRRLTVSSSTFEMREFAVFVVSMFPLKTFMSITSFRFRVAADTR